MHVRIHYAAAVLVGQGNPNCRARSRNLSLGYTTFSGMAVAGVNHGRGNDQY